MSVEGALLDTVLSQHFGSVVGNVGKCMSQLGPSPLLAISSRSRIPVKDSKKSVMVLIQHQLVQVILHPKGFLEYSISADRVLDLIKCPIYIFTAKRTYDESVESILVPFMKEGVVSISQLFKFFVQRAEEGTDQLDLLINLRKTFLELYNDGLITQAWCVSDDPIEDQLVKRMKSDQIAKQERYVPVRVLQSDLDNNNYYEPRDIFAKVEAKTRAAIVKAERGPAAKIQKVENEDPDDGVYWKLNLNQFNLLLRSKLMSESLKQKYGDDKLAAVIGLILSLSNRNTNHLALITAPVSRNEVIRKSVELNICENEDEIVDYIKLLTEDYSSESVVHVHEGGSMLSVKTYEVMEMLTVSCVSAMIESKFGESFARVFKIIYKKRYIHQNLIHELALIDRNKCKEITFCLVQEGFIRTMYYPKGTDYIPPKTFFIFTVDLKTVAEMIVKDCYKMLLNCHTRRLEEIRLKKPLIEKKNFIESEIAILEATEGNEQQIQDLVNSISEHDLKEIEKYEKKKIKLEVGELRINETLFLLTSWLELKSVQESTRAEAKSKK